MSALLTNATTAGPGAGVQLSSEVAVLARGVFDGATVELEMAFVDSPDAYVFLGSEDSSAGTFRRPGTTVISSPGSYWLRANIRKPGPLTSITVEANNA